MRSSSPPRREPRGRFFFDGGIQMIASAVFVTLFADPGLPSMNSSSKKTMLALEDGLVFEGRGVGAEGEASGELVFNTSMMGYQEILTDPSYAGQIITMTYPLIGNYGVNAEDVESRKPFCRGFVMRECCFEPSNWRATKSLPDYLRENHIIGIDGVDTRQITKHLREQGAKKAVISTADLNAASLVAKARDRKSTRLNSSHIQKSRMPSSA